MNDSPQLDVVLKPVKKSRILIYPKCKRCAQKCKCKGLGELIYCPKFEGKKHE